MLFHISLFRITIGDGFLTGAESSSSEEEAEVLSSEVPGVAESLMNRFLDGELFVRVGKRVFFAFSVVN